MVTSKNTNPNAQSPLFGPTWADLVKVTKVAILSSLRFYLPWNWFQ